MSPPRLGLVLKNVLAIQEQFWNAAKSACSLIEGSAILRTPELLTPVEVVNPAKVHLPTMTSSDTPRLSTRSGAA